MNNSATPLESLSQWYDSLSPEDQSNVVLHTFPAIVGWEQAGTQYVTITGTFGEKLSSLKLANSSKVVPYLTAIASTIDLFFALKSRERREVIVRDKLSEAKVLGKNEETTQYWQKEVSEQPARSARMCGYAESWNQLRADPLSMDKLAEWHRLLNASNKVTLVPELR